MAVSNPAEARKILQLLRSTQLALKGSLVEHSFSELCKAASFYLIGNNFTHPESHVRHLMSEIYHNSTSFHRVVPNWGPCLVQGVAIQGIDLMQIPGIPTSEAVNEHPDVGFNDLFYINLGHQEIDRPLKITVTKLQAITKTKHRPDLTKPFHPPQCLTLDFGFDKTSTVWKWCKKICIDRSLCTLHLEEALVMEDKIAAHLDKLSEPASVILLMFIWCFKYAAGKLHPPWAKFVAHHFALLYEIIRDPTDLLRLSRFKFLNITAGKSLPPGTKTWKELYLRNLPIVVEEHLLHGSSFWAPVVDEIKSKSNFIFSLETDFNQVFVSLNKRGWFPNPDEIVTAIKYRMHMDDPHPLVIDGQASPSLMPCFLANSQNE